MKEVPKDFTDFGIGNRLTSTSPILGDRTYTPNALIVCYLGLILEAEHLHRNSLAVFEDKLLQSATRSRHLLGKARDLHRHTEESLPATSSDNS